MKIPSLLKKHLGYKETADSSSPVRYRLRDWVGYFFTDAMKNKKNFYWAWKSFMIVVRRQHSPQKQTILIVEIPLKKAPYLVQKHIDITNIPKDGVVNFLLFFYDAYDSSPMLKRNKEYSVRYMSFISFLQTLMNGDSKLPRKWNPNVPINILLVEYIMNTLNRHGIEPTTKSPHQEVYSLQQIIPR